MNARGLTELPLNIDLSDGWFRHLFFFLNLRGNLNCTNEKKYEPK
jgi:hypothetical protein